VETSGRIDWIHYGKREKYKVTGQKSLGRFGPTVLGLNVVAVGPKTLNSAVKVWRGLGTVSILGNHSHCWAWLVKSLLIDGYDERGYVEKDRD
jgi:hypothetical protein